jgi:hypothetical protein
MQGFITACSSGRAPGGEVLRICQMPARARLDAPWPLQRVPLRATPHRVAFFAEARLYVVLASRQVSSCPWHPCWRTVIPALLPCPAPGQQLPMPTVTSAPDAYLSLF